MLSTNQSATVLLLAALAGGCRTAHAEFQLSKEGPTAVVAFAPASEPANDEDVDRAKPTRTVAIPKIARGFGSQVPLDFALKQIVPAGVRVTFARDLDPSEVLVDWKGGRPWPDVLRSTLRSPSLMVTFGQGSVLIEHWSAL